jgi:hypothetical protein
MNTGEILIYQNQEGNIKIDVRLEEETVWLTQAQLCDLFQKSKATISEHIKNVFEEGELDAISTVRKFRTVQLEGERNVERELEYYNLDVIISVGYRVSINSSFIKIVIFFNIFLIRFGKNYLSLHRISNPEMGTNREKSPRW